MLEGASADLAAALAEVGLSMKAVWYSSALLYGIGGLTVGTLYLIDPALEPLGVFGLACFAVVVAILCLLTAHRLAASSPLQEPLTGIRVATGIAIYISVAVILGGKFAAWALLPLFTVHGPWFLRSWKLGLPYALAGPLVTFVGLLAIPTAPVPHAVVSAFALIVVSAALVLTRQRTRALALRNRELAYTDPLTGVANMRMLREKLSTHVARSRQGGAPAALFAIDLDNFKQVNDRFDHAMGDTVLSAVALALREQVGRRDLVARRGGDEFSVLVPDAAERDLDALSTRLQDAIVRARTATCPHVTPSASVAYVLTREGDELAGLMERADQALHEAKALSRARRGSRARPPDSPRNTPPRTEARSDNGASASRREALDDPGGRHAPSSHAQLGGLFADVDCAAAAWMSSAILFSLVALIMAVLSLAGSVRPLAPVAGASIAAGIFAIVVACGLAAYLDASEKWLRVPWFAAYGLTVLAIGLAGASGAALLDFLPAMALCGCLVFETRVAVPNMVAMQAMYAVLAIMGHYPDAITRSVITAVAVVAVGGVVSRLRAVAVRFARTNRELSEVDELTGLANRRALQARLESLVEQASSNGLRPLLVAFDLDGFKQVNDLYSHSEGDRLLVAIARAVYERVRTDELVARRGGDEFVVVLANGESDDADAIVERIAGGIIQTRARLCPDLPSTASIAYARWHGGQSAAELLHEADLALHAKKAEAHARLRAAARDRGRLWLAAAGVDTCPRSADVDSSSRPSTSIMDPYKPPSASPRAGTP